MKTHCLTALGAVVFAVTSAFAGPSHQTHGVSAEPEALPFERISLYGDLRLRYELDYDSVRGDGLSPREDRNRFRTRTRLGVKYAPNDSWLFDARLRHGNTNSQQSPHVTWWQDSGDDGEQSDFVVDRLYMARSGELADVRVGRQGLPFWKPHEQGWDDDVYIDGAALSGSFGAWRLHAGAWYLPDGEDDHDYDERSGLFGGQILWSGEIGPKAKLTIADSLLFIEDRAGVTNAINDDADFALNTLSAQLRSERFALPLTFGADYYHNFKNGPATDSLAGDVDGFTVYAKIGEMKKKGDFQVGYYFSRIEKYAVARYLAQDDYTRFGSATQTRSSDFEGHELRVGYAITDRVNVLARAYFVETLSDLEDGNRFRLDLNMKF